jgi:ABC-type transporter lipoprotein component MlaA/pimeloyl-ACP methyl ester carboxylesterase
MAAGQGTIEQPIAMTREYRPSNRRSQVARLVREQLRPTQDSLAAARGKLLGSLLALGLSTLLCSSQCFGQETNSANGSNEAIILPQPVPDPIERFNRAMWVFNQGAMTYLVKPSAKAYRFIICKPLRTGIRNIGENIRWPGRLYNNLLQTRWVAARDETYRFLANSTIGLAGFFDVGTKFGIRPSPADFGQTFGLWGWKPGIYLMLPIYGPSNERDGIGTLAEVFSNPITYFDPYSYIPYGITYNNLTDSVDDYVRLSRSELDPYQDLLYISSFNRDVTPLDFALRGEQDQASLETLGTVFFGFHDPKFPERGKNRSVAIPATGRKLDYTLWLQKKSAPIVYINPGLGSHRFSRTTLGLAELLFNDGFSVVAVSSTFNYDFIEHASTVAVPGYPPADASDMQAALAQIDAELEKKHPGRVAARALLGYSMGAFQTLIIAATDATNESALKFERYVAIHTPVRLTHAVQKLDEFYLAPLDWPPPAREMNIKTTLRKAAALTQGNVKPDSRIPLSSIESRFLVGAAFHVILRDAIYSTQSRTNLGVLHHPVAKWRRQEVYREIVQYNFTDYLAKFLVPYFQTRGIDLTDPDALAEASSLRQYADSLRSNSRIRVIENTNDILVTPEDIALLRATLDPTRLTTFDRGGHLGNLIDPEVQKTILKALEGLKSQ